MLIRFMVDNFLSFRDETFFDMIPENGEGSQIIHDTSGVTRSKGKEVYALSVAGIYGANASGKTNLFKAMNFVREYVLAGTKLTHKDEIPVTPFLLSQKTAEAPSRFEIVTKVQGVVYTYGFIVSSKRVEEEWLYAYYTPKQEVMLFERTVQNEKTQLRFKSKLARLNEKSPERWVSEQELFLTFANKAQEKVEELRPLYDWFGLWIPVAKNAAYNPLERDAYKDNLFREFLSSTLRGIDTGIDALQCRRKKFIPATLDTTEYPDWFRKGFIEALKSEKEHFVYQLDTLHRRDDGENVPFELEVESEGTRRILHLLPLLYALRQDSPVILIDELDSSLHPLLSHWFLKTFLDSPYRGQSQLIFTTHDTSLLNPAFLRRDAFWFTEKTREGATHFTRLSEYRDTQKLDCEKGYLDGRFGGIPVLENLEESVQ